MPARHQTPSRAASRARRPAQPSRPLHSSTRQTPTPAQAARNVAAQPTPADLIQLQRSLGNQAAQRFVSRPSQPAEQAAPGAVQRKSSSGLAGRKATNTFARAAYSFWTDKANKDKTLKALSDHLIVKANTKIGHAVNVVYSTSGSAGAFRRTSWSIRVNTDDFSQRSGVSKVSDLKKAEVAEIVDTIYHEARHAEQFFRIARVQAGEGKTAKEIKAAMGIPATVAAAAAANPLEGETKADRNLIAEAKDWEHITLGKFARYKQEVYTLRKRVEAMQDALLSGNLNTRLNKFRAAIVAAQPVINYFATLQAGIDKQSEKDKSDKSVRKYIVAIRKRWEALVKGYNAQIKDVTKARIKPLWKLVGKLHDARYAAYRGFLHEKDTWAVGGAAASAFKRMAFWKR